MPDPLPPNSSDPVPPAAAGARKSSITCEFCDCTLGPDGNYLQMSDKARGYRNQTEEIERLKEALAQCEGASETLKRDLDMARQQLAETTKKARGW